MMAARAIIIEDGKLLVMHRNKYGSQYYTLVGGRVNDSETLEQGLKREVKEETGLDVVDSRLVFIEEHPEPYDHQYSFVCRIAPHREAAIQDWAEEAFMNKLDMNIHKPLWVDVKSFAGLQFRTPQLQAAVVRALKDGFPDKPIKL